MNFDSEFENNKSITQMQSGASADYYKDNFDLLITDIVRLIDERVPILVDKAIRNYDFTISAPSLTNAIQNLLK